MFPHVPQRLVAVVFVGGLLLAAVAWAASPGRHGVHEFGTTAALVGPVGPVAPAGERGAGAAEPPPQLWAKLLLHVLATVFGLRAGMKLFYENVMLAGFVAVVLIDALVVLALALAAPLCGGVSAKLAPQTIVTALVMVVTLHRFGFAKDRGTVLLAVVVAKGFGVLGEVGLRLLFLDAILRQLAGLGG